MAKTPPASQQQQEQQQQPPQPGDAVVKKKRKRWPWVLGVLALIAVIAVIIAVSSGGGGGSTSGAPDAPGAPGAPGEPGDGAPVTTATTYEVEGEGDGGALVTYTADETLSVSQEDDVELPWTKTVDLGGEGTRFGGASLTAQGDASVTSITCRVIRDGEVVAEDTSTGLYAVASCS